MSASPDSVWPQVRSTRLRITARTPARRCRSGITLAPTIVRISCGTPGTAYTTFSPTGQISPGAVPGISGIAVAPSGTSA